MLNRKVITVDGLLGTGKTTISKLLAKKLGYVYLSSGMLYRGIAYLCLENNIKDLNEAKSVYDCVKNANFELVLTNSDGEIVIEDYIGDLKQCLLIDGKNVTDNLFSLQVSQAASKVATHKEVRSMLVDIQRNAFKGFNIVAEGRDMGSVIFPNADIKFYIEVSSEVKAKRRFEQLYKGQNLSEEQVKSLKLQLKTEIEERDNRDINREIAPTIVPKEAKIIDNSSKTLTEVVKSMYNRAVSLD